MSDFETQTKKPDNSGGWLLCVLLAAILGIILIGLGLAYIPKGNAVLQSCEIINVSFPTEIPNDPNEISNNFATCDCGRNCISDLGYCIKVYVSVVGDNSTSLMGDVVQSHFTSHCTFEETNCFNGESLSDRIQALDTANETAAPFIDMMNTNRTIDCYVVDNNIFYENNVDSHIDIMITLGILTGLFLIGAFICYRTE